MKKLDFCTTATLRPELLRATYSSFQQHFVDLDFKQHDLYLNIDRAPVGSNISPEEVEDAAKSFFGRVVVRIGDPPSFPKAVKWCWTQTDADYLFHLEDDWLAHGTMRFEDILRIFQEHSKCYQIRLRHKAVSGKKRAKPALSPGITSKPFLDELRKHGFDPNMDPERTVQTCAENNGMIYPGAVIMYPDKKSISDNGRSWRTSRSLVKPEKKGNFITWVSE